MDVLRKLRVAVLDDDQSLVNALVGLLERQKGIEVVASWATAAEARGWLEQGNLADVLLVDQTLSREPPEYGVDFIWQVRSDLPATRFILLTGDPSVDLAREALRAGARGVVWKHNALMHLYPALKTVAAGSYFLEPEISDAVLAEQFLATLGPEPELLTDAERDIVILVAEGLSNARIAARRHKSVNTVKTQLASACDKLGAATRQDAVLRAKLRGLL